MWPPVVGLPDPSQASAPCADQHRNPYSFAFKMSYVILGRRVLNEHLALGTLVTFGTGVAFAMRGGSTSTNKNEIPPPVITSSSKDEENFIREFVANMEKEDAANKKH
ncbi:hypothetical protein O181_022948 [Austropuccinia psidii MF-1]|uniref:Uncharacterized protein n=1 Tax=Austropuccinia psidii MF-1 TaxID=1389203 RepID=A0A9Q3GWV1_9BASI|nr:hypothetical protein [Austropuccinia psidii MF-1]